MASLTSKMEAMEAETSKLKQSLIDSIGEASVEAFQTIDEYNSVLLSWYFKGFELLRRYPVKHPSGVDMGKLDLEEVDQEMAADEATHSSATETDAPESVPTNEAPESALADDAHSEDHVAGDA